jgi:hypothetical protein
VATPKGPPSAMRRLPWEELRDEIPAQSLVITIHFVRLVLRVMRDEIRTQVRDRAGETGGLVAAPRGDERALDAAPG